MYYYFFFFFYYYFFFFFFYYYFYFTTDPRWGSLRRSLRPPSRDGLLAFGNRSFVPLAFAIYTSPLLTVYFPPMDSNLTP